MLRLLNINATITKTTAPDNTGFIIKFHEAPPVIITRGSAPAGGCVVLVNCIIAMANPTPNYIEYHSLPSNINISIPIIDDII